MKTIPLTKGKRALVDDGDYERLSAFKWYASFKPASRSFYAERHRPRSERNKGQPKIISMSEDLLGRRPGLIVDHRNRNTLDYQRTNLRWATRAQNQQNATRPSKLGIKGVRLMWKRFQAFITVNKKRIHLGTFDRPEEAAQAYNHAAQSHFGEFARLNPL